MAFHELISPSPNKLAHYIYYFLIYFSVTAGMTAEAISLPLRESHFMLPPTMDTLKLSRLLSLHLLLHILFLLPGILVFLLCLISSWQDWGSLYITLTDIFPWSVHTNELVTIMKLSSKLKVCMYMYM